MNEKAPRRMLAALTVVVLGALFGFRDLPMVDLPQHAAQIAAWLNWGDPAYRTHELELNFRTPYLLAYPLARWLAPLFGVVGALKLVVAAGFVAHVAGTDRLVRRLGHDPWLALLGVPTALGYAFCFGFVSFLVAVPPVLFAVAEAVGHSERPTLRSGVVLSALLSLTLLAHGIALALAMLAVGPLLLRGGGRFVARTAPLLVPVALGALWLAPGSSTERIGDTYWAVSFERLLELPGMLVGIGSADRAASAAGLLLFATAGFLVGTPSRRPERWLPLVLSLLGYVAFPALFRGVGPLSPRFVVLAVPALLLAFEPRAAHPKVRTKLARGALVAVAAGWVLTWTLRLPAYNRETAGLHALVEGMKAGMSLRPIVFERESRAYPGVPALLHLPAYYQVKKGGTQGYSFAMYPISVVRYRAGVPARMGGGLEWRPEAFDFASERARYDVFVVHSSRDRTRELFGEARDVVLADKRGNWWAYALPPPTPPALSVSSKTE
ncbi:MAG TPA: hypothetical protein VFZ53_31415 [Polyangiaceae bacterium]